jgi:DMSO/TMAO reductase YedYZ molybdopterin-dependent catalytic subunit
MEKHHAPSEEEFYQEGEPPTAAEQPSDVIISPDTLRADRIPQGQSRTKKWPVLDAHGTPEIDPAKWNFTADGLVERPSSWSLDEFMALPAVRVFGDFHCVTRWSRLGNVWTGVSTRHIAELVDIKPSAKFVLIGGYDYGWTTNVPLENFLAEDALLRGFTMETRYRRIMAGLCAWSFRSSTRGKAQSG